MSGHGRTKARSVQEYAAKRGLLRHLGAALLTAYNPYTTGVGFAGTDLLVVALWGVGGLAFALWRFSWLPLSR